MSAKKFVKELSGSRVEGEIIKTVTYSLITSFIVFIVLYFLGLKDFENFIPKYGFFIFFAILSYAIVLPSLRQIKAYQTFACMSGMMIGMTIGMISGFLAGYYVAATNGMFWGSIFGMSVGIILGVQNGRCCGIMGVMEGMMSGFMGGLMGAMTAVMMINDHLRAAGVIIFLVSLAIMAALNYMVYLEMYERERKIKEDYFPIILASLILTLITIMFMVFGPRSILFG